MSTDQIILFSLFGAVFGLLLWGRFRYDIVAFAALLAGVVLGVVPVDQAFSGFGHPATIIVALVLVVSAGLVRSGAVFLITRTLIDSTRALPGHIAIMGGVGGVLSAFMNNVAALALLMPVDIQTARKAKRGPGLSLMPLSFATILGGMVTLIGTPPNIIIAGIREDRLGESFAMFDFAPVGLVTASVGLLFVALVGWRLIPLHEGNATAGDPAKGFEDFVVELVVPEGSRAVGREVAEMVESGDAFGVSVLTAIRGKKRRVAPANRMALEPGDKLVLKATPESLEEFRTAEGLSLADAERKAILDAAGDSVAMVEVVVPAESRIVGRSVEKIGLSWRKRAVLIGISRQGRRITKEVRKATIQRGDILLLVLPSEQMDDVVEWMGCLPLAERGLAVTEDTKTWAAIGLFTGAVALASFGLLYLPIALGIVVVGYVLMNVVPLNELYDKIEWPVVVLLGSMIPLGAALETSGGTQLIAESLVSLTAGMPAWAILTVLMVVTMTLSDVLNNTATAIVAAPVGIDMANSLGVSPDPFLMAVAVAASCAFLTPIGHKNNTLVLGPGGYRFGDYWRMGLPLEILVVAVSVPAILVFWPM
ncbi:MAG: SLC13 family permease [Rhodobacteraceae bacterium]|nr:SLC13 family permease [Paracoccaceae bacterium]